MSSSQGALSTLNMRQAFIVDSLVKSSIRLPGIYAQDITVISPYNAHMRAVRDIVKTNDWHVTNRGEVGPRGNVLNIDGAQGAENEIVIYCLVKADGFPSDPRTVPVAFVGNPSRVNVALTRAKEFCFVISDWC